MDFKVSRILRLHAAVRMTAMQYGRLPLPMHGGTVPQRQVETFNSRWTRRD